MAAMDSKKTKAELIAELVQLRLVQTRDVTRQKNAEHRLRKNHELIRMVSDSLPALIAYLDRDQKYVFANREYARWFGLTPESILGKTLRETVGAENFKALEPRIIRALQGEHVEFEDTLNIRDGKKLIVHARYLPHRGPSGGPDGFIVLAEDVNLRKQMELKLQHELKVNSALASLSRALIDPQISLQAVTESVLASSRELTGSEHGYVGTVSENGDFILHTIDSMMSDPGAMPGRDKVIIFPKGADGSYPALWGHALNNRQSFFTNDPSRHPASRGLPQNHIPLRGYLSVPAMVGGQLVGQIGLANPDQPYTETDLAVVGRLADLFALAVHRLRIEEALKQSESRYRTLYEESPISIWEEDFSAARLQFDLWREQGIENIGQYLEERPDEVRRLAGLIRVTDVNEATAVIYGAPDRQTLLSHLSTVFSEESYETFKQELKALAGGATRFNAESYNRALDGSLRAIHMRLMVPEESRQTLDRVIVSVIDITESKRFQEALRKSAVEWRTTFDAMTDPVFILNADHRVTRVNMAAAKQFGMKPDKVIGHHCWELVHPETGPSSPCIHTQTMADGKEHNCERTLNGRIFFCSTSPIFDNLGALTGSVHTMHDVTEIKRIEEERMRSSKLESIGVLAGGIAHDFNNILMGIMGNLSMARLEIEDGDDPEESLESAEKASMLAKDLTRQLLTFARGGAPVKTNALIRKVIEDAVTFVAHGSNVRCELAFAPDLGALDIDVGQVSQVVHNIVLNAIQAMPDGGQVTVAAQNSRVGEADGLPIAPGEYVRIAITDHGQGIPDAVLPKIFDPYFTTKQKGTGLGLATSYSIIVRHGGTITVDSKPRIGSCFTIYLPADSGGANSVARAEAEIVGGSGRVLLMDDEEIVRTVAARMLQRLGYEAVEAEDGAQAVDLYRRAREEARPFRAVIMDLTVPGGMGGKDAIRELIALDPDVRAIVASGYSHDPVMSDCRAFGFRGMVGKPFKLTELAQALAEATGGGQAVKAPVKGADRTGPEKDE